MGRQVGLVSDKHWDGFLARQSRLQRVREQIESTQVDVGHAFSSTSDHISRASGPVGAVAASEVRLEEIIREGALETDRFARIDIVSLETAISTKAMFASRIREIGKLRKPRRDVCRTISNTPRWRAVQRGRENNRVAPPKSIAQASGVPESRPRQYPFSFFISNCAATNANRRLMA